METGIVTAAEILARTRKTITAPSGFQYLVRRPSVAAIVATGLIPAGYVGKFFSGDNSKTEEPTDESVVAIDQAMRATIIATILEPKVVAGAAQAEGEIGIDDLPKEDAAFVYLWAQGADPEARVLVAGGEVSAGALQNFPVEGRRGDALDVGGGGATA